MAPDTGAGRVAVVGSGISGLSAASRLERAGYRVELVEQDEQLGGRFGVATLGGRPVMLGGKNIGRRYTSFRELVAVYGDQPYEPFGINASRVTDDRVLTIDSSRRGRSLRSILQMGTPRDLARLAWLAYRIRANEANRFLGAPLFTALARKHDHAPLSVHFGDRVTRNLLRPMTVRMNGAEPDEVYLGTFGTNLALLLDSYDQLSHGIQPVIEALARRVTVRLGTRVDGLVMDNGALVGLRLTERDGPAVERRYDGVVVATPAHATAEILRAEQPVLSKHLDEVRYFPSTVAIVEYDRPVFASAVRALAFDEGPCSNAGSYGKESRHVVRYTFSGRRGRMPDPSAPQLEGWISETEARLTRHLGVTPGRRVNQIARHWSAAYCAYVPYHGDFLAEVRRSVAALPGLALAGDYLRGVSLEACCRSGASAATDLMSHMDAER